MYAPFFLFLYGAIVPSTVIVPPNDSQPMNDVNETASQFRRDFEQIALPHLNAVYHFAYNLVGNTDDAKDLLQETYLKALRFFDTFQRGTNCKAWLFQIAKNSFINRYRKQSREPDKVSYDAIDEFYDTIRPVTVASNNLDITIFHNVMDDEVSAAVLALPDLFREVLILSDLEDLTYEEIADVVNCPIGTVRSRLHRARKILRNTLYEYARKRGFVDAGASTVTPPIPNGVLQGSHPQPDPAQNGDTYKTMTESTIIENSNSVSDTAQGYHKK